MASMIAPAASRSSTAKRRLPSGRAAPAATTATTHRPPSSVWRRKVDWDESATAAPITPLLDVLELTRGIRNWGLQLQKGHLALTAHDFRIIAHEMGADSVLTGGVLT